MKSSLPVNLFLLLFGALCWCAFFFGKRGSGDERLLGVVCALFGTGLIAMSLIEILTDQGLIDLLSSGNTNLRRAAVVVFAIGAVGMCALCAFSLATGGAWLQIAGAIGLLLFGVGGAFAIFAYWHQPADYYYNQALDSAFSDGDDESFDAGEDWFDEELSDEDLANEDSSNRSAKNQF